MQKPPLDPGVFDTAPSVTGTCYVVARRLETTPPTAVGAWS
jgi:hypothetical protein